jgi:hypothetical protein
VLSFALSKPHHQLHVVQGFRVRRVVLGVLQRLESCAVCRLKVLGDLLLVGSGLETGDSADEWAEDGGRSVCETGVDDEAVNSGQSVL